jgi:hypothetical protein
VGSHQADLSPLLIFRKITKITLIFRKNGLLLCF